MFTPVSFSFTIKYVIQGDINQNVRVSNVYSVIILKLTRQKQNKFDSDTNFDQDDHYVAVI